MEICLLSKSIMVLLHRDLYHADRPDPEGGTHPHIIPKITTTIDTMTTTGTAMAIILATDAGTVLTTTMMPARTGPTMIIHTLIVLILMVTIAIIPTITPMDNMLNLIQPYIHPMANKL